MYTCNTYNILKMCIHFFGTPCVCVCVCVCMYICMCVCVCVCVRAPVTYASASRTSLSLKWLVVMYFCNTVEHVSLLYQQ